MTHRREISRILHILIVLQRRLEINRVRFDVHDVSISARDDVVWHGVKYVHFLPKLVLGERGDNLYH